MNRILKRCSLPRAQREFHVVLPDGTEAYIDFAYPPIKLGIEVDGYGAHVGSKRQWQRDIRRENSLKRLGWVVLHYSWEDVRDRPEMIEWEVREWFDRLQQLVLGASEDT
jgi:very-short-patch-repair endonuclease